MNEEQGWTLETLRIHLVTIMDERDRRYQERFCAQEQAVRVALDMVNKEFHEHIVQVREETQAALTAADKAIAKSEEATNKRFESVNELSNQVRTFLPRVEYDRSLGGLSKRLDELHTTMLEKLESTGQTFDAKIESVESKVGAMQEKVQEKLG